MRTTRQRVAIRLIFGVIFALIVLATGFTFTVTQGTGAVVSRFGRIAQAQTQAGLHLRLPWPIDEVIVYDMRRHTMQSGHIESLTHDMINVILQSYVVYSISDLTRFHLSVGDELSLQRHLNDLIANTKNSVMGHFQFSHLISTQVEALRLDEINQRIEADVRAVAYDNLGVEIHALRVQRVSLPHENIQSIFMQMAADRQRVVSQYMAEGERDAAIIISEAYAQAAEILAQGMLQAAQVDAQTEAMVAELLSQAYAQNPELFIFLQNLMALENAVNTDTAIILQADDSPFGILTGAHGGIAFPSGGE